MGEQNRLYWSHTDGEKTRRPPLLSEKWARGKKKGLAKAATV